jgi:hypothetical protein
MKNLGQKRERPPRRDVFGFGLRSTPPFATGLEISMAEVYLTLTAIPPRPRECTTNAENPQRWPPQAMFVFGEVQAEIADRPGASPA